jgi:hypothetical protein
MECKSEIIEVEALRRVETLYRSRLLAEPGDMVARVSLAWCLFLQALHRAGEERMLHALVPGSENGAASASTPKRAANGHEDAETLVRDSLRQAVTVLQLSPDPRDRVDVERLQALITMSGGGQAVCDAEADAARILAEVSREIMRQDGQNGRLTRLPLNESPGDASAER